MSLLPKQERDPAIAIVAYALAGGVPFAAYLATGSPHAYWLDSGEFVESAVALDIAHPPGHPLAAMLGHAFTWIPLGPLALRVALAQAVCAAIAAVFMFAAVETTVRSFGIWHARLSVPISLGATWLVACSHAFWFQAVRPEVYALQNMLLALAIERAVSLEARWPTHDVRPLWIAALAIGLGLANHHFMAVLVLPALAPTMARVYRARGGRSLMVAAGAGLAGLAAYAYLPVRSSTDPPVDLGHPTNLERLWWVVSARAYQHTHQIAAGTASERASEVAISVLDNIPVIVLVLAAAGLYALARAPGARRIGWIWGAVLVFAALGRTWIGHTHGNPDALGYLGPAFMAIAALAAAFVAAVLAQLQGSGPPRAWVTAIAIAVAALGLARIEESRARSTLSSFHATDDFDELRVRSLPTRAVVIAHLPQTVFRHWELAITERARPDVTLVPVPFLTYPGMVDQLIARDPSLADLIRGYLLDGALREPDLQSLAARRPVLVEMDVRVPRALYETIAPHGLYYEVSDARTTDIDVRAASEERSALIARLTQDLGSDLAERETRNQLLWPHYVDSLYYAQIGLLPRARESVARGLELSPDAAELLGLREVIERSEDDRPIDVSRFIVGR